MNGIRELEALWEARGRPEEARWLLEELRVSHFAQALGVLMHAERISATAAFEILRRASQSNNRKLSVIAAEVVRSMTGHEPEPPRPLSDRS